MKKRTIIFIALISFLLSLTCFPRESAFAEEEKQYSVALVYAVHTLPSGGRSFSYQITYQPQIYDSLEIAISDRFYVWSFSMQESGYKTEIDSDSCRFTASISFDNAEDYLIATGYDGFSADQSSSAKETKTFFFTDYEYSSSTVFADLYDTKMYIGRMYRDFVKNLGIADENAYLCFEYGTPYSTKMITTNADSVTYDTEKSIYLHDFIIDPDNIEEEFVIYQHSPNATGWYLLALLGGVMVFGIVFAVLMIKKTKERS